jgi:uncharacterized protein (TIGR02271 family)
MKGKSMIDSSNLNSLIGGNVIDRNGDKIGTVGQIYVDTSSGAPTWVSVKTGLFGMSESFVPLTGANSDSGDLRVEYDKDFVKDAPRVNPESDLSVDEENTLYSYYGMDGAGTSGTDAGTSDTRTDYDTSADVGTTDVGTSTGTDTSVGYDTSGPTTDSAMTRSEEQLHVGTETVQSGRARLRKHVVTENQTVTVPVSHEEVRLEREPITDANADAAYDGPAISEEEHEVVLTEERVVVDKEAVPVERVSLGTETVTEQQQVNEEVRKEEIELEGDTTTGNRSDGTQR